ncbi:anti-sigma factor [Paenibacillus sp. N4]|uniref:anti-sigma factor domain-containing protein n=1 Tax=Paenibacillus vietnamensis TaxID=2590547 RepID=UPI001CD10706|nr:anti-sigma factor [Paenibacillus vietnamensis]MCA0755210.1 anti-sigma factor [Paenibacillus vietnamensis]
MGEAAASDELLIRLISLRDRSALEQLYDRYERPVYAFVYRIVKDETAAESIVRELYIRVWNAEGGSQPEESAGKISSWMFTDARNLSVDWLREHGQKIDEMQEEAALQQPPVSGQAFEYSGEEEHPPEGMKDRIMRAVSWAGLAEEPLLDDGPETALMTLNTETAASASPTEGSIITEMITVKPFKARRWIMPSFMAATAALLLLSGALLLKIDSLTAEKERLAAKVITLEERIASTDRPLSGVQVNQAIALSPTAKDSKANGLATVVNDEKGMHLILQAESLPRLAEGEAFQVWLLRNGKPVNAGTFLTHEGTGALYYTFAPESYDQIAITHEPDMDGSEPRGTIVLAGSLAAD